MSDLSKAANDVLAERARQIESEGWTAAHDDVHRFGEMAGAAACYAINAAKPHATGVKFVVQRFIDEVWPWDAHWWKPKTPRADLVKAGALILAEIERLDRAEARRAEQTT
jgi:hypothetical protein